MKTVITFTGTNLDDALEGYDVSLLEAEREIEKHGKNLTDFLRSPNNHMLFSTQSPQLNSRDILIWLGY